jgi:threonylcarbamoyladenosine tRNA methylthiotransferase MtaB
MNFPFSYCHVFTYSERKGTPASKMKNHVPIGERRQRSAHLRRLSASKKMEFYKKQEGDIAKVLFEKVKDGLITGYTENYTRVILRDDNVNLENQILKVELGKAIPEFIECKRVLESRII